MADISSLGTLKSNSPLKPRKWILEFWDSRRLAGTTQERGGSRAGGPQIDFGTAAGGGMAKSHQKGTVIDICKPREWSQHGSCI